ncbi:peptidylprolyl isomerase [Catenibacillus scindens]|uniref:peptidylprolyl isomerase n=1 Tax=Catenibacillus scindens TaxID=673271 RepID=UPI00320A0872
MKGMIVVNKLFRTLITVGTCLCLAMSVAACSQDTAQKEDSQAASEENGTGETQPQGETENTALETGEDGMFSGKHHVEIEVQDYGVISVELDADIAPITVTNFMNLAQEGFYDGLTFHRIIEGFMIQGGDPTGTGMGGSENTIKGEFSANGVDNSLSHTRGVISMARAQDYDSASSQFFIVQQDSTYLDGQYAAFGVVTDGMDIVDQICEDTRVEDTNGTVAAENQPVITSITVID